MEVCIPPEKKTYWLGLRQSVVAELRLGNKNFYLYGIKQCPGSFNTF